MRNWWWMAWLGLAPLAAFGHAGEEHGEKAAPAAKPAHAWPRAEAASEAFEVVAVLAEEKLILYVDHAADNAPVETAEIEVESGQYTARATRSAAGVYEAPAAALAAPGSYLLTVTVQTPEVADLLAVSLERPAPAMISPTRWSGIARRDWAVGLAAAGIAVFGAGLLIRRGKQRGQR